MNEYDQEILKFVQKDRRDLSGTENLETLGLEEVNIRVRKMMN